MAAIETTVAQCPNCGADFEIRIVATTPGLRLVRPGVAELFVRAEHDHTCPPRGDGGEPAPVPKVA